MGRVVTRAWWRRNAVALGAIVVLLPVTAAVITVNEWWGMNQAQPVFPTTVDAGATVDFGGATWGPVSVTETAPGPRDELPAGARLVTVEVPVDPHGVALGCSPPVLRDGEGAGRRFDNAANDVDWDYARSLGCDSERTGSYVLAAPFLLPADAVSGFVADLTLSDELPRYLRFVVDVP
jgi:hypothetical protein